MFHLQSARLQIFSGQVPFSELRDGAVILEVAVNDKRPPWPVQLAVERGLSDGIWAIMQACWKTHPDNRPDMWSIVSQLEVAELYNHIPMLDVD